jgi:hypothetical protein
MKKISASLACLFMLASCFERPVNPGEIAFVNGAPITLKQLQSAHDAVVLAGDSPSRAMPALQREYGEILAELVVQELVLQELERQHLSITEEELAAEEALIRADFPGDEFERMMLEESIDIDNWRQTLYRSLSMRKFWSKVLRQQVTLTAQEVEEYYLKHQEDFQVPEVLHFIQISGMVRDQINAAAEQFKQLPDAATIQGRFPGLTMREIHMHVDRLAPEQLAGLTGLRVLDSSGVTELNGEFFSMILLGKEKARTMTRTETYALIEGILLEEKAQAEFDKWVNARLARSTIKVSTHLIPENLR